LQQYFIAADSMQRHGTTNAIEGLRQQHGKQQQQQQQQEQWR
jgi:hypothetical protein